MLRGSNSASFRGGVACVISPAGRDLAGSAADPMAPQIRDDSAVVPYFISER